MGVGIRSRWWYAKPNFDAIVKGISFEVGGTTARALKGQRDSSPLANDKFEAAVYWCQLGRWAVEGNTKVNYPARARGEKELLAKLRDIVDAKGVEDQVRYSHLLDVVE